MKSDLLWWMSLACVMCAIAVGIGGVKTLSIIAGIALLLLIGAVLRTLVRLWWQHHDDEPKQ